MNHLETYLDRIIDQQARSAPAIEPAPALPLITPVEATPATDESNEGEPDEQALDILGAFKRRWYIIFLVFALLAPVAVRAVWYFVDPGHIIAAQLKIAPAVLDIMTGNEDRGFIGNYREFVATQAVEITSTRVIVKMTPGLDVENIEFFTAPPGDLKSKLDKLFGIETPDQHPEDLLQRAVNSGIISASHRRNTHVVDVRMKSMYPRDAILIVNALIDTYTDTYKTRTNNKAGVNLELLEKEKKNVYARVTQARKEIRESTKDIGAADFGTVSGRAVSAGRINTILERTIQLEARRVALETQVAILEKKVAVTGKALATPMDSNSPAMEIHRKERLSYIDSDVYVRNLTRQVMMMEEQLLVAREQLAAINPVLHEKEKRLKTLQGQLETAREVCGQQFNDLVAEQAEQQAERLQESKTAAIITELNQTRTELIQALEEERRFRELLKSEEDDASRHATTYLDIRDTQDKINLDMEIYDRLSRRIKQMEMEKDRAPRITVLEEASRLRYEDKRVPYSAGVAMGVLGLGCLLALLIDKADKRVKEPEELVKLTNLPLIGTVANARTVKAAKFAAQIASDYQTIRTNLTLLGTNGMPKHLCVTSPGPREGKSSFSLNLATSLSKSGERVLLIDGDLRKPDSLRKMNFVHMTEQVSHVPIEGGAEYSIWNVDTTGLDILVPDAGNRGDVYESIVSPMMTHRIMNLSQKYDHVIIDTPPLLAFPDALIWARISGVAIMIGFAGRTTIDDLLEARDRLGQTNVQLLGTVLNNVKVSHGYQRYHYGYYDHKGGRRDLRMNRKLMMGDRKAQKSKTARPVEKESV